MNLTEAKLKELIFEAMGDEFEQAIRPAIMRALDKYGAAEKSISRQQHSYKGQNWGHGWQILFTTRYGKKYLLEFVDFQIFLYTRWSTHDTLTAGWPIPDEVTDPIDIENWFYQMLTTSGVMKL